VLVAGRPHPARRRPTPRRGGRPSRADAERLGETILDVAAELFLAEGYGVTSIEAIARRAGISKRTFYSRFRDKADLFAAVVRRVVERLRAGSDPDLFDTGTLDTFLPRLARLVLRAALSPQALALHRVILAEATRFPELATVVTEQGGGAETVARIAARLAGEIGATHPGQEAAAFAAAQFLQMVIALPQRRALGLGAPMAAPELERWVDDTVALFLGGWRALAAN
jgi:TetR/AcrR family transcriptional regulator, mexJK operon transcriptional repressor